MKPLINRLIVRCTRKTMPECTVQETPRQSAATLIVNGQNEVLLVHKAYGRRVYGLPGGGVDPGELPTQAAVREAREELGVKVRLEYQIGLYYLRGGGLPDQHATVYFATIVSGQLHVVDPSEIQAVGWHDLHGLPALLNNDARAAVDDFIRQRRGVLREVERRVYPV